MDISQKSRAELKSYFVTNAIPTQGSYYSLIEAALNKKDDGLTKSSGGPLCIEAQPTEDRPVVSLYESFSAQGPSYVLSLLPGTTTGGATTGKGFSIGDGTGAAKARVFIESSTGNVGIGTISPGGARLAVAGPLSASGLITASGGLTVSANQSTQLNGAVTATAGATISGSALLAQKGATVSGGALVAQLGASVSGGKLTVGSAADLQGADVYGTLTAYGGLTVSANQSTQLNGAVTATAGATISGSALLAQKGATISGSALLAQAGATISGSALLAQAGATISGSALLAQAGATVSGAVLQAQKGATVSGGSLTVGSSTDLQTAEIYGAINAYGGLTVASGQTLTAQGAATITGTLTTKGNVVLNGTDLLLDNTSRRGSRTSGVRRALVHDGSDYLSVNFAGDYTGGVKIGGQVMLHGPAWAQDNAIYLRSPGNVQAGVGYFGSSRPFAGSSVDGPGLYGNTGGVLGTIRPAATGVEGSLVLNGSTGHVVLPTLTDDFSGGITVEAWVYLTTLNNSYCRILDLGNGSSNNNVLFAQTGTSSALRLDVYNGSASYVTEAAGVLTTNTWMHLVATLDSTGVGKIYKNGVAMTVTSTGTYALPGSTTRTSGYIGRSNWPSDALFPGKLAHVKLWTRVLSADEVSDSYTSTRPVSTSGLAGWWPLDDGAGTTARDRSGRGRSGTLSATGASFEVYQGAALTWDSSNNVRVNNTLTVANDATARGGSVVVAGEQLRIVRGTVNSNGTVLRGSGFSVSRASTGLYDITFLTAFANPPTVVTTQLYPNDVANGGGDPRDNSVVVGVTASLVRIKTGDNAGNASDRLFHFIAIG
ncbi:MAG: LamG-like jellyroll fold domain-containing protein [Polyangia bacterium]